MRGACAIFFCSPSSVTVYPTPLCRARLGGEVPGLDEFTMAQEWVDQKMEKAKVRCRLGLLCVALVFESALIDMHYTIG